MGTLNPLMPEKHNVEKILGPLQEQSRKFCTKKIRFCALREENKNLKKSAETFL